MNLKENIDWLVTKSVTKLTREEVDVIMMESLSFEVLNNLLIKDVSDVRDYIREKIVTMPVTKSVTKIIELINFLAMPYLYTAAMSHQKSKILPFG